VRESKLQKRLIKALAGRVAVLLDSTYALRADAAGKLSLDADLTRAPWVLVVARERYFESTFWMPVDDERAAKKILVNSPPRAPYSGVVLRRISQQDNRVFVREVVVPNSAIERLGVRPYFVVPEGWLLGDGAQHTGDLIEFERGSKLLALAKTPQGCESAVFDPAVYQVAEFALSVGIDPQSVERISPIDYATKLSEALLDVGYKDLATCFQAPSMPATREVPWQFMAGVAGAASLVYVMITWLVLSVSGALVDAELERLGGDLDLISAQRREYTSERLRFESLEAKLLTSVPYWLAWRIIKDLQAQDVDITAMTYQSGTLEFSGTAPSATATLEWLLNQEGVKKAEFALPVRGAVGSKRDFFAITLTLDFDEAQKRIEEDSPELTSVAKQLPEVSSGS
jgi:hypothetical protein